MKPETASRRLFAITRSKGKMYELGISEAQHIALPPETVPQTLFLLTVGTLGDVAAQLSESIIIDTDLSTSLNEDLNFSASFFDAFLESRLMVTIANDTALLAACAYYLAGRPGSSLVVARKLARVPDESQVEQLLRWILLAQWQHFSIEPHPLFGNSVSNVAQLVVNHFRDGSGVEALQLELKALRRAVYACGTPRELLFADVVAAILRLRLASSAWTTLPGFSGLTTDQWAHAIRRADFPTELWPSQILLGKAGLYAGKSAIVQMPTSAGKTRSIEIVLRSGFLADRAKLAVVVAPFKALCHEIGTSLRRGFRQDNVKVNELSDAMQLDFLQFIAELSETESEVSKYVLVLTPEKLHYVLRQAPALSKDINIIIYDEGHQFDSGSRGITYELLLTEIKALLQPTAQTILVSAVIQNAQAIGNWLIGDKAKVVNGTGLLTTARSVAFASWLEARGQLIFFDADNYDTQDYFVPRAFARHPLTLQNKERKARFFPEKTNANEIALYLGIRLVPNGAVAIFCGTKNTASSIAKKAVAIYERGFDLPVPATVADVDELRRLKTLIDEHFGDRSIISRAASLGIFVHHGTTPQGLRLAIEHGMQQGRLKFVACTSTLAQGVNLPIRYLIVPGIRQGNKQILVRDFQNLIGRVGRSGMHTEGLVVFSDPDIYDKRKSEAWKFRAAAALLSPDQAESTTSSLLALLEPFDSNGQGLIQLNSNDLCALLLSDEVAWRVWATNIADSEGGKDLTESLIEELRRRRPLLYALESHLMANRGAKSFQEFCVDAATLATQTLAYHLASDELKKGVCHLFVAVATYIEQHEPLVEKQAVYAKTLLGLRSAKAVEQWVITNQNDLLELESNEAWLMFTWPLFVDPEIPTGGRFYELEPRVTATQNVRQQFKSVACTALRPKRQIGCTRQPSDSSYGTCRCSFEGNAIRNKARRR